MAETLGDSVGDTGTGALLRASRMRIGEELRDIADILRIRYPYLKAIEEDRFDDLPGQPYAVGFVRAYAVHLGLDADEIVRRFKVEFANESKSATELSFPTPIAEANVPGGAIVFIGLLMAVLAYGFWYISTSEENYLADLVEPIPERLASMVSGKKVSDSKEPESIGNSGAQSERKDLQEKISNQIETISDDSPQETVGQPEIEGLDNKAEKRMPSEEELDSIVSTRSNEAETDNGNPKKKSPNTEIATPVMAETPATNSAPSSPETSASSSLKPSLIKKQEPMAVPSATEIAQEPAAATASDIAEASSKPLPTLSPSARAVEIEETASASDLVSKAPTAATGDRQSIEQSEPRAGEERSRIVVRAKLESWIQVQDYNDKIVFTDLLKAGDEYEVPNKTGLRLETGNAGALEILVDGKAVPPIGGEGVVRRGVKLNPALLKAGKALSE